MEDLFTKYSISEIFIFLAIFATALKGFFSIWDWAVDRLKTVFKKDFDDEVEKNEIIAELANIRECHKEDKLEIITQVKDSNKEHLKDKKELLAQMQTLNSKIEKIDSTVHMLVASDKDDIKSWITQQHHHFCYVKKAIDDYSLDCIEKRYEHYCNENGNSYVATLMQEIRSLPKISIMHDMYKK